MRPSSLASVASLLLLTQSAVKADDSWREALLLHAKDESWRAQLSGFTQVDYYRGNQENVGLIFSKKKNFVLPRATFFVDADWKNRVYGFAQVRFDRGFDPGESDYEIRLDEFALRFPLGTPKVNLQVGQFATVLGNWAPRHDAWQNPFVGAPLPYELMTGLYDRAIPRSPYGVEAEAEEEDAYAYNPVLWGPVYATGAALTAKFGRFDFAGEVKNAGPSSRPEDWSPLSTDFSQPTFTARLGYRPDLRTRLGLSVSDGGYLANVVQKDLAPGRHLSDFRQRLFGLDVSYAWHHWQIWAEAFVSEFTTPYFSTMRSVAGYVEARYKVSPHWIVAGRWNRQTFNQLQGSTHWVSWGIPLSRWDAAVIWRPLDSFEVKSQVSLRDPSLNLPATTVYALQAVWRF